MLISLCDFVRPPIETVGGKLILNVPALTIDEVKPEIRNELGPTTLVDAAKVMQLLHDLREEKLIASARNGLLEPRRDVPPSSWRSVKEAEIDWRHNAVPPHNLWDVEIRSGSSLIAAAKDNSARGRKPSYDWPMFEQEVLRLLDEEGLPAPRNDEDWRCQADIERRMSEWCAMNWRQVSAESTVRAHAEKFVEGRKGR